MGRKTVKLVSLELTNYRNIDHAIHKFDGNSKIVGDNRIGKTNTLEAIYWLLSDKLLNGNSDVAAIKPSQDTKKEVRVIGTFDVDGKIITIEKRYGEDWVKTRGTADIVMKGHYCNYFYNTVPTKTVKAFEEMFYNDFGITPLNCSIDVIRLLIDPTYLAELGETTNWTELRAFIISLIGDVKDEDVFFKNPKLAILRSDLELVGGRVDQLKKKYKGQIDELKDTIVGDDANIKLLESTDKVETTDYAFAKKKIEEIDEEVSKLQDAKKTDAHINILSSRINEKTAVANDIVATLQKENPLLKEQRELWDKKDKLWNSSASLQFKKANAEVNDLNVELTKQMHIANECETFRNECIIDLRALDEQIKNPEKCVNTVCPTCGRPLEENDKVAVIDRFVSSKQVERENLLTKGRANRTKLDAAKAEIETLKTKIASKNKEIEELRLILSKEEEERRAIHDRESEIADSLASATYTSPELDSVNKEIEELKTQLKKYQNSDEEKWETLRNQIQEKLNEKEPYQKVIDDFAYYQRQMSRLEETKTKKNEDQRNLAILEQKYDLLSTFIFTKLQMLDENVARVFGNIKFQLIKMNINGGYDAICKPYIYDIDKDESTNVTWKSGSKSEKVVTGIAIAEKIKEELQLPNMPFLFDEGGEISTDTFNTKFKTDSQLICVKVQDNIRKPIVVKI